MKTADPRVAGTVIFDLDTTLVLDMEHSRSAFSAAAQSVSPDNPGPLAEAAIEAARDLWRASDHAAEGKRLGIASWEVLWADFEGAHPCLEPMKAWAPGFRQEVWIQAMERTGIRGSDPQVPADAFVRAQRLPHPLVPGGVEALRAVASAGRKVAILTNGPPDIQRHKLSKLNLDALVSTVVISGETGLGKPDREAFSFVLEAVGGDPADAVMVGDSWNRDMEGALGSGLGAVWLSFGRPVPGPQPEGLTVVAESKRLSEALGC